MGFIVYELNGSTSLKSREFILFDSKVKIENGNRCLIIANIQSCAEGLNMQHFNHIIMSTPDWNEKLEQQAIGRAHRIGQKKQVYVYKFLHKEIEAIKRLPHIDGYMKKTQVEKVEIFNDYITNTENAATDWDKIAMPNTDGLEPEPAVNMTRNHKKLATDLKNLLLEKFNTFLFK
jgi:superfamily II DNA or RNA helicase